MTETRWSRESAAVLLHAIRSAGPGRRPRGEPDAVELAQAAAWHGVAGYVRRALEASTATDRLPALDEVCRAVAAAHLSTIGDLTRLQDAFAAEQVAFAVVKGPVVAEALHGDASLRGYGDLDVLVEPADLRRAVQVLQADGATLLDRNWPLLTRKRRGEVHLRTRRGTVVDLHWHLINEAGLRDQLRIVTGDVLERTVAAKVGPLSVPTTDATDTLLHLAIHATVSGGDRLIWFKDVERAASRTVDWDRVVARAREWQAGLPAGQALWMARRLAGADVPVVAIRSLASSRVWRTVAAAASVASPPARSGGGASPHRMVGRSTRADLPTSAKELARRTIRHATGDASGELRFDATDPGSPLWPAGEPGGYYTAVLAEARSVRRPR